MDERQHFNAKERSARDIFFHSLITTLCNRVNMSREIHDTMEVCKSNKEVDKYKEGA